jgi:hypothetical protein
MTSFICKNYVCGELLNFEVMFDSTGKWNRNTPVMYRTHLFIYLRLRI